MSTQPSDSQPAPLSQLSQSRNNALAIRVVPYTPPRIASEEGIQEDQSSTTKHDAEDAQGRGDGQPSWDHGRGRVKVDHATGLGLSLSTAPFPSLRLVESEDEGLASASSRESSRARSPVSVSSSRTQHAAHGKAPRRERSLSSLSRPLSRNRNVVTIHSDKTFSIIPQDPQSDSARSFMTPPLSYSSREASSNYRPSMGTWSDGRGSSPLTSISPSIPDRNLPPRGETSASAVRAADEAASSSRKYPMLGGLRQVRRTPDSDLNWTSSPTPAAFDEPLSPLFETHASENAQHAPLSVASKPSFASSQTKSTISEATNYKVYSRTPMRLSSDSLALPSSSHSNYEILGTSSPAGPFHSSPPDSPDTEDNYIVYDASSPVSLLPATHQTHPTYSQESLLVAPLRPAKKELRGKAKYYRQRSRSNSRARAGSVKTVSSIKTISSIKSVSSIFSQEAAQAFLATPFLINIPQAPSFHSSSGESGTQQQAQDSSDASQSPTGPSATHSRSSSITSPPQAQVGQSFSNRSTGQLSAIMSESEGGSSHGHSRSVSRTSASTGTGHRRRSSAGWTSSTHGRHLSLATQLEGAEDGGPGFRSDSVERPRQTYSRSGQSGTRTVRNQDEHGDGLADLHEIHPAGPFTGSDTSSRHLHSSASSRANSFSLSFYPTWARLYYGSQERRVLRAPSVSTLNAGDSRPGSSAQQNRAPYPYVIRLPPPAHALRRHSPPAAPSSSHRPQSSSHRPPSSGHRPSSSSPESMSINPVPPQAHVGIISTIKRKTSSVWSPHLRTDRRADRYSVWDPPDVSWSADSGLLGRRNAQVLLFIIGFIFPFAWMTAAFLPLPPKPKDEEVAEQSAGQHRSGPTEFAHRLHVFHESVHESARWWRNVNRIMCPVGILVIAAIITLAVVGSEGWA